MIKATVIADSKNSFGNRLTTMIVTFPRIILAENNTHRMVSKNSASSRAIPYRKMVETMFGESNLRFTPIAWQKDHSGMQGHEYFTDPEKIARLNDIWDRAAKSALESAEELSEEGVTKQLCNRLLEPFMWQTVIVSATEWENFFHLRCPQYAFNVTNTSNDGEHFFRSRKDVLKVLPGVDLDDIGWRLSNKGLAEIHMMELAEVMWDAFNESVPKELEPGKWHIPFGDNIDFQKLGEASSSYYKEHPSEVVNIDKWLVKVATARCARVSYTVVGEEGKEANYENDFKLHDRLAKSGHWSPFEHCAVAMSEDQLENYCLHQGILGSQGNLKTTLGVSGNFQGFVQYRKTFFGENVTK